MTALDRIKSFFAPAQKSTFYPESSAISLSGPTILPPVSRIDYAGIDAMTSSIVMACVNSITRCFPEARFRVMRRNADGESEEVEGHPLTVLLSQPNQYMTAYELWQSTLTDYNVPGNSYWWAVPTKSGGGVAELYPLPARLVRAEWPKDGREYISHYSIHTPAGWKRIEKEQIIHFRNGLDWGVGSDGRYGLSPLQSVRREVYVDDEAGAYSATMLRNVGVVGAVFTPKVATALSEDDKTLFRTAFQQAYTGDNRGRPMIFGIPMDIQKIAFSASDMDMESLRRICEERISALLNVPAIVAGLGAGLERSTFSNTEQAVKALWENNIIPTHRAMCERLNVTLLARLGKPGEFCDFDRSQVAALNESRDLVEQRAREAFTAGVATRNEARERLGYPPDPQGDVYSDGRGFDEEVQKVDPMLAALQARINARRPLAELPPAQEEAIDA